MFTAFKEKKLSTSMLSWFMNIVFILALGSVVSPDVFSAPLFHGVDRSAAGSSIQFERSRAGTRSPTAKRSRDLGVNVDLLTRDTQRLELEVFPGEVFYAVKTRFDINPGRNMVWRGKLVTEKEVDGRTIQTQVGTVVFVIRNDRIHGTIHYQNETYVLKPARGGGHRIKQIDPRGFPEEHPPLQESELNTDDTTSSNLPAGETDFSPSSNALVDSVGEPSATAEASSINNIRLIVAYTADARNNSADIIGDIELAVVDTESSYIQTGLDDVLSVELVHAFEYDYTETGDASTDLANFETDSEIHAIRDQYQADIAIFITETSNYCGIASGINVASNEAFAVVKSSCLAQGRYTFAHEIGHLQGARHDPDTDSSTSPYAYGHGYRDAVNQFRTVMAYNCENVNCVRVPHWSSPTVFYNGHSTGNSSTSNNARVLRERAQTVANFWSPGSSNGSRADIEADFELENEGYWVDGTISFTANFTNNGPNSANNLTATITLPGDVDLDSYIPSGVSCSVELNRMTCHAQQVAVNNTVSVAIVTSTVDNLSVFPYTVKAYAQTYDADISNNEKGLLLGGEDAGADVKVSMTGSARTVNNQIVVNVIVANDGPNIAEGVELFMPTPAVAELIDISATNCSVYNNGQDAMLCPIESLSVGETQTVTFTYRPENSRTKVSFAAEALVQGFDANLSNNRLIQSFGGSFSLGLLFMLALLVLSRTRYRFSLRYQQI